METKRIASLAAAIVSVYPDKLDLREPGKPHDRHTLADAMLSMNIDAFRERYGRKILLEDMQHIDMNTRDQRIESFSPVQLCKTLQCFLYQCSEGDVPDKPLFQSLKVVESLLSPRFSSDAPEYEAAVWG
jgi:hypothetical protein